MILAIFLSGHGAITVYENAEKHCYPRGQAENQIPHQIHTSIDASFEADGSKLNQVLVVRETTFQDSQLRGATHRSGRAVRVQVRDGLHQFMGTLWN